MGVPAQCPACGSLSVSVSNVAPANHSRGDEWMTRATCTDCGEYAEWFD